MKIAVTGATGFIGRKVVDQAISQSMELIVLIRKDTDNLWLNNEGVAAKVCDYSDIDSLSSALQGVDIVLHLAADMRSSNQYVNTMHLTENVLASLNALNISRLILVSSISVLDYISKNPKSEVLENWAYCEIDSQLGDYARMKRDQEKKVIEWAKTGKQLSIVRPGLVIDNNLISDAHAGFFKSGMGLGVVHDGKVPLVMVNSVALGLIKVANKMFEETEASSLTEIYHFVDDALTTQKQYKKILKSKGFVKLEVPVPWQVFNLLSGVLRRLLSVVGLAKKIPDTFKKNSVAARLKPFEFSNQKSKDELGWQPEKLHNLS